MKISKIQDSLSILITLAQSIDVHFQVMKKERGDHDSIVYAAVSMNILLQTSSFLAEWEHLGSECKDDPKVIEFRKKIKPLTSRIYQWTDLVKIRNTFLAHNFRDSKNNNENVLLKQHPVINIPDSFGDYLLLCGCVQFIFQVLRKHFDHEYQELYNNILSKIQPFTTSPGITSEVEAMKELNAILAKVETNFKS